MIWPALKSVAANASTVITVSPAVALPSFTCLAEFCEYVFFVHISTFIPFEWVPAVLAANAPTLELAEPND